METTTNTAAAAILRWAEVTGQNVWDIPTALEVELAEAVFATNPHGPFVWEIREIIWEEVAAA